MPDEPPEIDEPVVPPHLYDEEYYQSVCGGSEEWTASEGRETAGIYPGILRKAQMRPGEVVVDVGCGRGELLVVAAKFGASKAIGIDYAETAIRMAKHTIDVHGVADVVEVHHKDGRRLPVHDGVADLATLVDVVEHVTPAELDAMLREVLRVLRPGGRVFVHTMPNRLVYDVTYRLHRSAMRLLGHRWPAEPRLEHERLMHVNEQTRGALRTALRRAGYAPVQVELGEWIHTDFLPDQRHARLYAGLARFAPTRALGVADLFATGWKPA